MQVSQRAARSSAEGWGCSSMAWLTTCGGARVAALVHQVEVEEHGQRVGARLEAGHAVGGHLSPSVVV